MFSPQKKKGFLCDGTDVLTNALVTIILQYIKTSGQYIAHLTLHNVICQLHLHDPGKIKVINN